MQFKNDVMHMLNAKSIPINFHSTAFHRGYIPWPWYYYHSNHLHSSFLAWRAQNGSQPRQVFWPSPLVKPVDNTEAGVTVTAPRDPVSNSSREDVPANPGSQIKSPLSSEA